MNDIHSLLLAKHELVCLAIGVGKWNLPRSIENNGPSSLTGYSIFSYLLRSSCIEENSLSRLKRFPCYSDWQPLFSSWTKLIPATPSLGLYIMFWALWSSVKPPVTPAPFRQSFTDSLVTQSISACS